MTNIKRKAQRRLVGALFCGLIASSISIGFGHTFLAPLLGWDTAALFYLLSIWPRLWNMDSQQTRTHAQQEDPSRKLAHSIVLLAATTSLGAAVMVLGRTTTSQNEELALALFTIMSIVLSWATVQTLYTLHYAVIYYQKPEGGVEFNQKDVPTYSDFAYLAFTVGMTFQVSDTAIGNRKFRKAALVHALFSFLFGTIIIATTINLVAGLGK